MPVSLRELYETDDPWFVTFTQAVVDRTVDVRNEMARKE